MSFARLWEVVESLTAFGKAPFTNEPWGALVDGWSALAENTTNGWREKNALAI